MAHLPGTSSTPRGVLSMNQEIPEWKRYLDHQKLRLTELRTMVNFLTDRDYTEFNGFAVPKRKKAFIRHIKHLSEQLEEMFQDNLIQHNEMEELLTELILFQASLIQKASSGNVSYLTLKQRWKLGKATYKSKKWLRYDVNDTVNTALNVNSQHPKGAPYDSPYWHHCPDSVKRYKRFGILAKEKKIKAKKNLFVVFEELSYTGTAPKIRAMDLDLDNEWSVKWGDEVHTDVVGSRIFAALGYDVDHPYFYGEDKLTLIFDQRKPICSSQQLCDSLQTVYNFDLQPFISSEGNITKEMAAKRPELMPYLGQSYVRFYKCAAEGRPDRVKRIGSFVPDIALNENRRELRGVVLAHAFIGNWDTRIDNTLLTTVHNGNYEYRISAVFSDLGTSMGVSINAMPNDFKVGIVNEFGWEVAERKGNKVQLYHQMNTYLLPYHQATFTDLLWMAHEIATLDEKCLRKIVSKAGWPDPIAELYFHKLASRRSSILLAFDITDPNPISFDRNLTIIENGKTIIKNGKLMVDYERSKNPESFLLTKGRFRNYGN